MKVVIENNDYIKIEKQLVIVMDFKTKRNSVYNTVYLRQFKYERLLTLLFDAKLKIKCITDTF